MISAETLIVFSKEFQKILALFRTVQLHYETFCFFTIKTKATFMSCTNVTTSVKVSKLKKNYQGAQYCIPDKWQTNLTLHLIPSVLGLCIPLEVHVPLV